jgi:hypothetical protein
MRCRLCTGQAVGATLHCRWLSGPIDEATRGFKRSAYIQKLESPGYPFGPAKISMYFGLIFRVTPLITVSPFKERYDYAV